MLKPKAVGSIVIIYALAAHLWGGIGFLGLIVSSEKPLYQVNPYMFLLSMLPGLYLLSYLAGGIGLILLCHWAGKVVFLAAIVELIAGVVTLVSSFAIRKTWDITIGSSIFLVLYGLAGLVVPGVIAYMALWLHRHPDAWQLSPPIKLKGTEAIHEQRISERKEHHGYIFWGIIVIGAILPWIVGITVKLYLDAHGKPTLPWSYFINFGSLIFLIPVSVWFAIPYIILAYVARNLLAKPFWGLESYVARLLFIGGGLVGGCIGTVMKFIEVFWEFDPLFFVIPLWVYYIPHMLIGLFVGFLVVRGVEKYFLHNSN